MRKWSGTVIMALICIMTFVIGNIDAEASTRFSRVYMTKYELIEGTLAPGENVTLALTFYNPEKRLDAYNILLTYATDGSNVRPVYGNSNQVYIDRLKPQEEVTVEIELHVIKEAVYDEMVMQYYVTYGDDTCSTYEYSATIAAPLTGTCQIDVGEVYISESSVKGHNSLISVQYSNTGEQKIESPIMHIEYAENDKEIELDSLYARESATEECYLLFDEVGEIPVSVYISYSDQDGFTYTTDVHEYAVAVTEEKDNSGNKLEEVTPEGVGELYITNTQLFIMAAFIVFALIVGILLFGNKRKSVK